MFDGEFVSLHPNINTDNNDKNRLSIKSTNMKQYKLGFISDKDIFTHVKETVQRYSASIDLKEFNKRVGNVINNLVEENHGNRIIVVTTPDVVQAAVALTLNLTPKNQFKVLIKTGSLTQISYFIDDWSSVIYSGYMPL